MTSPLSISQIHVKLFILPVETFDLTVSEHWQLLEVS